MEEKVIFTVDGIHCPKCVEALEKHFLPFKEIKHSEVSSDYKEVVVVYDSKRTGIEQVKSYIESTPGKEFRVMDVR